MPTNLHAAPPRWIRRGLLAIGMAAATAIATQASGEGVVSHLHFLELEEVALDWAPTKGGAIDRAGRDLVVVRGDGTIAVIHRDRSVAYLDDVVPMRRDAYMEHDLFEDPHRRQNFRVADMLLRPHAPGEWTMFVSHHWFAGDCIRFRVSRTRLRRGADGAYVLAAPWTVLFDAEPCFAKEFVGLQAGGKMLADGDGSLLIAIGDHARDGWSTSDENGYLPALPQAADSHMGKLVRLDTETGEAEILSVGLRNPQGLARDAGGALWATEHGPNGGDELNLLEPGSDYGWPLVTLGRLYEGETSGGGAPPRADPATVGLHDGFAAPVFSWVPSIGVSAVAANDARHFPLWRDDLLIASLGEHSLYRVRRDGGRVQYVERIELGQRLRDIALRADGGLALLADAHRVLFLTRSDAWCVESAHKIGHAWAVHCDDEDLRRSEIAWRSGIEAIMSGAPSIRSEFDVWFDGWHTLTWVREDCAPEDMAARFFLRISPMDAADLPEEDAACGFADFDFTFAELPPPPPTPWGGYAGRLDDKCVAGARLPKYDISRIETGQFIDTGGGERRILWKGEIFPPSAEPAAERERFASSDFDVHVEHGQLVYVGKDREAGDADDVYNFFLHATPVDDADLPEERRENGFDNLDFRFFPSSCVAEPSDRVRATYVDGECVIAASLPEYAIDYVATGRFLRDSDGELRNLWRVELDIPPDECPWISPAFTPGGAPMETTDAPPRDRGRNGN